MTKPRKKPPRVRTPEGVEKYDQPINSVIRKDVEKPKPVARLAPPRTPPAQPPPEDSVRVLRARLSGESIPAFTPPDDYTPPVKRAVKKAVKKVAVKKAIAKKVARKVAVKATPRPRIPEAGSEEEADFQKQVAEAAAKREKRREQDALNEYSYQVDIGEIDPNEITSGDWIATFRKLNPIYTHNGPNASLWEDEPFRFEYADFARKWFRMSRKTRPGQLMLDYPAEQDFSKLPDPNVEYDALPYKFTYNSITAWLSRREVMTGIEHGTMRMARIQGVTQRFDFQTRGWTGYTAAKSVKQMRDGIKLDTVLGVDYGNTSKINLKSGMRIYLGDLRTPEQVWVVDGIKPRTSNRLGDHHYFTAHNEVTGKDQDFLLSPGVAFAMAPDDPELQHRMDQYVAGKIVRGKLSPSVLFPTHHDDVMGTAWDRAVNSDGNGPGDEAEVPYLYPNDWIEVDRRYGKVVSVEKLEDASEGGGYNRLTVWYPLQYGRSAEKETFNVPMTQRFTMQPESEGVPGDIDDMPTLAQFRLNVTEADLHTALPDSRENMEKDAWWTQVMQGIKYGLKVDEAFWEEIDAEHREYIIRHAPEPRYFQGMERKRVREAARVERERREERRRQIRDNARQLVSPFATQGIHPFEDEDGYTMRRVEAQFVRVGDELHLTPHGATNPFIVTNVNVMTELNGKPRSPDMQAVAIRGHYKGSTLETTDMKYPDSSYWLVQDEPVMTQKTKGPGEAPAQGEMTDDGIPYFPGATMLPDDVTTTADPDSIPDMTELIENRDDDAAMDALRSLEGEYGSRGLRFELDYVAYDYNNQTGDDDALWMYGNVYDGDDPIGQVKRVFSIDEYGNVKVHNELLEIQKGYRGSGFGTNFYRSIESWYRRSGVPYIDIMAALEDGAYAWGKAGFIWDPRAKGENRSHMSLIIHQMKEFLDEMPTDEDRDNLEEFIEQFASGNSDDWPPPYAISTWTDSEGTEWGKKFLYRRAWLGIKYLQHPETIPGFD